MRLLGCTRVELIGQRRTIDPYELRTIREPQEMKQGALKRCLWRQRDQRDSRGNQREDQGRYQEGATPTAELPEPNKSCDGDHQEDETEEENATRDRIRGRCLWRQCLLDERHCKLGYDEPSEGRALIHSKPLVRPNGRASAAATS
jgi:hypothetical protein